MADLYDQSERVLKILHEADVSAIQAHLKRVNSGVSLPTLDGQYQCFKGRLDANDVNRLILWWEFEKYTFDGNCTLAGLLPSAEVLPRVRSFIEGRPSGDFAPLDLVSSKNLELVLVTNNVQGEWLYIIDGNHRAIAQVIQKAPFQDVPVFVYEHTAVHRWAYIPNYYKNLWHLN